MWWSGERYPCRIDPATGCEEMECIGDFACTRMAFDGREEFGVELTVGEKKIHGGDRWERGGEEARLGACKEAAQFMVAWMLGSRV